MPDGAILELLLNCRDRVRIQGKLDIRPKNFESVVRCKAAVRQLHYLIVRKDQTHCLGGVPEIRYLRDLGQ